MKSEKSKIKNESRFASLALLLISHLCFGCYFSCAAEALKIKPSEIFSGIPTTPTISLDSKHKIPNARQKIPPTPTQSPILIPTPLPTLIPTPTVTLTFTPTPSPTSRSRLILDNSSLKEFLKTHPTPPFAPTPEIATRPPDIEELRRLLHTTPTPTPRSEIFSYPLKIELQGAENPWGDPLAIVVFNFRLRNFYAALWFDSLKDEKDSVHFLKNTSSRERFSLKAGDYKLGGEFWLPQRPRQRIRVAFGTHHFRNHQTYAITLNRDFERIITGELEVRNAERQKSLARQRTQKRQ